MKKIILTITIIGVTILFQSCKKKTVTPKVTKNNTVIATPKIPTVNITDNQIIKSPLEVKVNSQGIWFASEGELGTVTLVDQYNKIISNVAILSVYGDVDWMTNKPVPFQTIVNFNTETAKKGTLIIKSNPGQGDGDEAGVSETIKIPVLF